MFMAYLMEWKRGMPKLPKIFTLTSVYALSQTDAGKTAMKFVLAYADKHGIKVDKSKFGNHCTVTINGDCIYFNTETTVPGIYVSKLNQYDISEYLPELYGEVSVKPSGKKKLPENFILTSRGGIRFFLINDQNTRLTALKVLKSICSGFIGDSFEYFINDGFKLIPSCDSLESICVEDLNEYELPPHIESIITECNVECDVSNLEGKDVSEYVVVHSIGTKDLLTSPMGQDFFDFIDGINLGIGKNHRNCVLRKTDDGFSLVLSGMSEYSKLVPYTDTKNMSNVYTPEEFMKEFGKEYLARHIVVTAEEMKQHEANNYSSTSSPTKTMSTFASEKIKKFFANTNAVTVISDAKEELDNAISSLYFALKECERVRNGVITLREALNDAISRDDVDGIEEALDKIRKSAEYVDNFGKNKIEDFTAPKKEFDVQEFFK